MMSNSLWRISEYGDTTAPQQPMRIVEAAMNGSRARDEHPAVPITADDLAGDADAVVRAGAGTIHFHIRSDSGEDSLRCNDLARAL